MLDDLAKKHSKWMSMALKLCGCKDKAQDMVQDMYLEMHKLHEDNPKESYKDAFVWGVMYSTMIDECRKKVRKYKGTQVSLDCVGEIAENNEAFELSDEDLKLLSRAKELRYLTRYYLEKSYDHSLRGLAELNGAKYWDINRKLKEGREHILKDRINEYKNARNKHK